jgi:hypothetical protein
MALFRPSLIEKNGKTISKTLLLNTDFIQSEYFQRDSDSKTVFYYETPLGRRTKVITYVFDGLLSTFKVLLEEAEVNDYVSISGNGTANNLQLRFPHKRYWKDHPVGDSGTVIVRVSQIFEGEDLSDGSSSVIKYTRGAYEEVWLRNPYTIEEIDGSGSGSGSLA